jgi:hypothetical protein
MADAFFSLHCKGQEDPIYISEVIEKAMNPTFRFGPAVTRLDTVTVKVWVKRNDFLPLIEEKINLQSLQFIGTLKNHSYPPNSILFHLIDGIYSIDLYSKPPKPKSGPSSPTSSYSALMRLSNLDESIQDALATRDELANQINAILRAVPVDESPQAQEEVALVSRYVSTERKHLKQTIRRREELKASIAARSKAIKAGKHLQAQAQSDVDNAQEKLQSCRSLLQTAKTGIHGQRRRICEELSTIFPIEATDHPLLFTICGLPLPNTHFDDADEDVISAALGYVARVVDMLQYYLSVPLPYPISAFGSRSLIQDFISIIQESQRTFPLYMKGTVGFRFDYGVFLLNKNIECLAESQGLKVIDIRQTLPNLKYLLYVCSAGSSELPARKAGGIRGLLTGRGTPTASRRGSIESAVAGEDVRKALELGLERKGNGRANVNGGVKMGGNLVAGAFGGHQSLRTSGLRENVMS